MLGRLVERRGTLQSTFGSGALFARQTATGVTVTSETALRLSAVYASVRLIADTISTLPVDQFIRRDGRRVPFNPREPWVQNPSVILTRTSFYKQVLVSLLLDGNAYIQLVRDGQGRVESMMVLNPRMVEPEMTGGRVSYRIVNTQVVLSSDEVLHITEMIMPGELKGVSRVEQARDALGLGLALEEYASRFFGNGAYSGGVIEHPGDLTPEQAKDMVDTWESGHRGLRRSHRPAVLYGGAKFTPTTVNPSESQLLDERRFAVEEVARIFRIPPFMLGVSENAAMAFASIEQQQIFFRQHTILPYIEILEDAFSTLLLANDSFIKFNLSSLVRADLATRTESYSKALLAGFMSVNDVRALEDLAPVADGDEYRVPLQNIPLTDTPILTLVQKGKVAQSLTIAGFDGDSIAKLLDLDVKHTGLISVQTQPEQVEVPADD